MCESLKTLLANASVAVNETHLEQCARPVQDRNFSSCFFHCIVKPSCLSAWPIIHGEFLKYDQSSYYSLRITKAQQNPRGFLSIVTDGMAQTHSVIPWLGDLASITPIPQHIQGVLAHGRKAFFYRTFHNISSKANLQIHTILLTLEKLRSESEQRLPPTLFIQTDGGSENTAKVMIFFCELLVARGVFRKVVLSRLMVGQTHCDIDALFGRIWVHNRVSSYLIYLPLTSKFYVVKNDKNSRYVSKVYHRINAKFCS